MPISRTSRMDRRRRFLRESIEPEVPSPTNGRRSSRGAMTSDEPDGSHGKRKAGYSQDVRKTCGQRLVQLIPVRKRSFAAVIFLSLLVPGLLLTAHYLIFVTNQLRWWGHPLATALDIGHPRSIAAWLSSQLWLLCLAATVLTFQLRRHKLDDYNGEYRLWPWLVVSCLIASIDATTSITQLFAQALDRWSQLNLGWSGPAVVEFTLAALIGMLGLRLCSELKSVPFSLVFWLLGLAAWAGSAALGRPEFKLELSPPVRYWLHYALWLGGLTAVWLSALAYLRNTYIEAQRRFLLRGRVAVVGTPWRQRLRESMDRLPVVPHFRRSDGSLRDESPDTLGQRGRWIVPRVPAFLRRRQHEPAKTVPRAAGEAPVTDKPTKSGFRGWLRAPKNKDDADEYRKLESHSISHTAVAGKKRETAGNGERTKRGWLPKLKLPKLKFPSLRLPPPEAAEYSKPSQPTPPRELRPVNEARELPRTSIESNVSLFDDENDGRPLSKAARKRLKRLQQQNDRAA